MTRTPFGTDRTPPAILAQDVGKSVAMPDGALQILDDINLSIEPGASVAIVGTSGSGKSTLLGLLAGLDSPSSGRIWIQGEELSAMDEDGRAAVRRRRVGFVFQNFQLLPSLTTLENVLLPLELQDDRRRGEERRERARALLSRVGLEARSEHFPRQLSGGEQQRVALARAFVTGPEILFADEPTGNLDEKTGKAVTDVLFELNQQSGTTLILVTHDPSLAARCGKSYRMQAGQLLPLVPSVAGAAE